MVLITYILNLLLSFSAGGWISLYISPRFTFSDIPDLSGKVAIVTGSNTGIGYVTARELALKGATVVVAARSAERGMDAVARITKAILDGKGTGSAVFLPLDLGSFKSIRQFVKEFRGKYSKLDILVNNAGVRFNRSHSSPHSCSEPVITSSCVKSTVINLPLIPQPMIPPMYETW